MSHLVLLSGWGIDARIWRPLEGHWPAELTVTAPDWPGYGARPPLAHPEDLEALAAAMTDDLPATAVWVGWSLGGLLTAALLERLPTPRALVLLGTQGRFTADGAKGGVTARELTAFRRAFVRDPQRTWQHFLRWQLSGEPSPRGARQRLGDLLADALPADTATLASGLAQLASLDMRAMLRQPPCPVVTLRGEHDPLLPAPAPHQEPEMLADCGHCPQLSAPRCLARRLSEIARLPGAIDRRETGDER